MFKFKTLKTLMIGCFIFSLQKYIKAKQKSRHPSFIEAKEKYFIETFCKGCHASFIPKIISCSLNLTVNQRRSICLCFS